MSKSNAKEITGFDIKTEIQNSLAKLAEIETRHKEAPTVDEALRALNAIVKEAGKMGITQVVISAACGFRHPQNFSNTLSGKTSVSMIKVLAMYRATKTLLEGREQKKQ